MTSVPHEMHIGAMVPGSFDPLLVALSVLVAVFASYAAFELAAQIRTACGTRRLGWLAAAAASAGGAIWAMHFIGMLAYDMGMPVQYSLGVTVASLLLPILLTGLGFAVAFRGSLSITRLLAGAALMGLGIIGMHFLGMSGMQMGAVVHYNPWRVGASALIAFGTSAAALWLVGQTRAFRFKLAGACAMGAAISGMHYTGMMAATFVATPGMMSAPQPALSPTALAACIAGLTSLLLFLATGAAHIRTRRLGREAANVLQQRLSSIAANLPGVVYRRVLHPDGRVTYPYISEGFADLVGADPGPTDMPPSFDEIASRVLLPEDAERWRGAMAASASCLSPFQAEARIRCVDGTRKWIRSTASVHRDAVGSVVWDGVVLDITDQKEAAERLEASLLEKEALLKEIHHRVKNNLQVVSGLLSLEGSRLRDAHARQRVEAVRQRLSVLSDLHTQLYQADNLARVDIGAHLKAISRSLSTMHQDMVPAEIHVSCVPLHCEIETAIPLGLIVNELVTNSLKHAFPEGRPGRVEIICRRLPETHQVELAVSDDGVGFPPGGPGGNGLGTALVRALAAQLGGILQTASDSGACTRVLVGADRFESVESLPVRALQLSDAR